MGLCVCLMVAASTLPPNADPKAYEVLQRFERSWRELATLSYVLKKTERLENGKMAEEEVLVKLRKPSDFYLAAIRPKKGQEVIYSAARDAKELTAHRGSFPDVTVSLNIHGSMATRNQHHLVTHSGYGYLLEAIQRGLERARLEPAAGDAMRYGGEVQFAGRRAQKVILEAGKRPHVQVRAPQDESLYAFARRVAADAYLLAYLNPQLEGLSDRVEAGETYTVPQTYGSKVELLIDQETGLSLSTTVWDFDGKIYERFEHHELVVDVVLSDVDFDPENPAYGF